MSTPRQSGGLSLQTLVIASAASVAAAIVVHKLWKGGAIFGAAITPVIVAIVSETLRKPVDRVSTLRDVRRQGTQERPVAQPDRFGIWEAERRPWWQRRATKLALGTGLLAFVIGAFALTAGELVFGGSVGGGNDRLTLPVGGEKGTSTSEERTTTTDTEPEEEPPPAETAPTVPPQEQVPETAPPAETAPVPPVTPSPTEPAPSPTQPPAETPPAEPVPTP